MIAQSYVKDDEFGASAREDAVDHELDKFERGSSGANVSRIADAIASNGNTSVIRIGFFRADFANHLGVCYFFVAVSWDGIVVDDEEGVGAVDEFSRGIRVGADTLAEAAKFS